MKFFDRLRTHQSYSRLLGLLLAIWSRVDSFILDIYRHAIEQDSLAGQTSFIPFPLFLLGGLGLRFILTYSEEFDPGSG